jgi:lipoate-protein ligase A
MSGRPNPLPSAPIDVVAHLDCRLLIDGPAGGPWNMAVDEILLETTSSTGRAALRFYQWREPTLSLGYFQRFDDRSAHPTSGRLPVVRRSSGGKS